MSKHWPQSEHPRWQIRHNDRMKDYDKGGVSGKVIVKDAHKVGVCRVRFSDRFTEDLGHRLPFGVSSTFPVFLRLTRITEALGWYVSASYFHLPGNEDQLWVVGENMPEWAKVEWNGGTDTSS